MKGYDYITFLLPAFLLIFPQHAAIGQEMPTGYNDDINYLQIPVSEKYDRNVLKIPQVKNAKFSLNTGVMVIADKNKNYIFYSHLSAFYSINISRRFSIRAGNIIFFPLNHNFHESNRENSGLTTYSGIALFAAADYYATDRLTITGSFYKTISNRLSSREDMPQVFNRSYYAMPSQSFSLGMNYKIFNGLSIGAEIRFSDYYQPVLNPFNEVRGFYNPASLYW